MKIGLVVAGGLIENYSDIKEKLNKYKFEYIVACDSGLQHLHYLGLKPDLLVGDFDSVDKTIFENYSKTTEVKKFNVRKDYTDGEIGIKNAIEANCEKIIYIGATGNRLDHTLSNLSLCLQAKNNGVALTIIDNNNEVSIIDGKTEINNKKGYLLSILPITLEVKGVTTENLDYPLNNETIYFGDCRTISNVVSSDKASITINEGLAYLIFSKD